MEIRSVQSSRYFRIGCYRPGFEKQITILYGPSGTGKSSFIAAVANLLSYDVYNVNLSQVSDDADLNMLPLQTTCKSLIVVEHLDLYILEKSMAKIASSGFLNFMDGILNFQDERIMILQSNGRNGGKAAPQQYDSAASSPAPTCVLEEAGGAPWKETVPKEFRKLYELLG